MTNNSQKFEPLVNYQIGVNPNDNDKNEYVSKPKFSERPFKSVGVYGHTLINDFGCKTFLEYLQKNPHHFPTSKTISCVYYDGPNDRWVFFGQGNPLIFGESVNLADGKPATDQIIGSASLSATEKLAAKTLNDSIEDQRQLNKDLQDRLSKQQNDYYKLQGLYVELQGANKKLEIENETMKGTLDRLLPGNGETMNDKPGLMDAVTGALANPQIAASIGEGLGLLVGWAKTKFGNVKEDVIPEEQKAKAEFEKFKEQAAAQPNRMEQI